MAEHDDLLTEQSDTAPEAQAAPKQEPKKAAPTPHTGMKAPVERGFFSKVFSPFADLLNSTSHASDWMSRAIVKERAVWEHNSSASAADRILRVAQDMDEKYPPESPSGKLYASTLAEIDAYVHHHCG